MRGCIFAVMIQIKILYHLNQEFFSFLSFAESSGRVSLTEKSCAYEWLCLLSTFPYSSTFSVHLLMLPVLTVLLTLSYSL
ncbi:uncharacterized protein MICPUCDRAFT_54891 [Micromonas pusilla CCMP1545]|uniref:Predicted protein n=1 Tax=Micromonas pusilla (strain CCMP1545) TaxID=564608 RepID=C1NAG4_MICPC|nr:uncharacterized protein MICPUCDRAFT_54891 [Micromonas pusilla CCMP1545]EEH50934.1 predicted protein [Micromonas pusilla CCMP1545]|eukprot:XP_003064954.1 predicted protein [Micromonas pusilla CCMP1545]